MNMTGPWSSELLIFMFEIMLLEYQYRDLEALDSIFGRLLL